MDKVKSVAADILQRWKSASRRTKGLLGGGVLAVLVTLVILAVVMNSRPYATLFTDLSQSDMSAILTYLSDNGVTQYKVEDDTILVPEDQEATRKAQVLQAGYPSSGYGYDTYFDNVGSLTTETERNQLVLYALQDRMQAVIRNFDGVKDAAVLLTPGEDHTYVLDSGSEVAATASVTVTMEAGKTLTDNQVKAIRNLVSSGLAGLNVANVEIGDTYGNTYSSGGDFSQLQDTSELKMKLEEQWNNSIRSRILQALIPIYGEDNVRVSVNTVVDVDRTYTDSTDYSLEDWAQGNDDGIIGTQIWNDEIVRDDSTDAGGTAGTSSNADLDTYVNTQTEVDGTEKAVSTSGQTDHLVDTKKQQVEHVAGYISDVSVAVTINQDAAGSVGEDNLYPHVARAAGIAQSDERNKISILVAPFYQPEEENQLLPTPESIPEWVLYAAIGGGILFLTLMLAMMLLHRHNAKKRQKLAQTENQAVSSTPAAPAQPEIMEMQTEKSMELRQSVRKFAEENPEIAAQMVKNWLREGE